MSAIIFYHQKRGGKLYSLLDVCDIQTEKHRVGNNTALTMNDGEVLRFSEADLLAALISYCLDKNIPLPMRASKHLHTNKQGVTLNIAEWEYPTRPPREFGAIA